MANKQVRIGWYMSEKKSKQLSWQAFTTLASSNGAEIVKLDLDGDAKGTENTFDIILLKMTDELVRASDPKIKHQIDTANAIVQANPNAVVVDLLENQAKTVDRGSMHDIFQKLNQLPPELNIRCPMSTIVYKEEDLEEIKDFNYPLICKTVQASGALEAHQMGIVWRKSDLSGFDYPFFVQEYLNHNATIFKIYVVGEESHLVIRKSLPNFKKEVNDPVMFNSQDWKHDLPAEHMRDYSGKNAQPDMKIISQITQYLSKILSLSLYGYDVITDIDTGKYAIIDLNYYPEYKGVSEIQQKIYTLLLNKLQEKRQALLQ